MLRIYDKNGNVINDVRFVNHQEKPIAYLARQTNPMSLDNTTLNYWKIKVTDSYIYGLYVGKTYSELNTNGQGIKDYANEIHVWDWDGNPIIRFILNRHVFSFSVSTSDEFIVCSTLNDDDKLFKFSLR
jgi:hypothetical protein